MSSEISGLFQKSQTIYLDIQQEIVYKGVKSSCKECFLGHKKPAKNSKQLLCGFFYQASESLLPGSTKSESLTCIYRKLAIKRKEVWDP
jgi:hypothetical protein